ncbi:ABC transporter permease [Teredinibacter haidensis]|uniref:ABC transporter permease n=1 Tax=Teredinibacter haidensis TaxID=2731755 RepID=UPI00094919CC|nr:ABC transporter permease [Teredinibacter haidensis]
MISLTVFDTFLSTLPLLLAIALFQWKLNGCRDILVASARMVLQLIAMGYLLAILFEYRWNTLGIAVITFMTLVSAAIAIRPLKSKSWRHFNAAALALFLASGLHLAWIVLIVLKLSPWYQPQLVVPLAGMVFANGMNSLSLGAERFEAEQKHNNENAATCAFNAAMIPQINALLAVGLVSLPGMMTGQILSGISPLEAVRYQIMVMSMVAGTSALSLTIYFYALNFKRQ